MEEFRMLIDEQLRHYSKFTKPQLEATLSHALQENDFWLDTLDNREEENMLLAQIQALRLLVNSTDGSDL
jgi:hypothetical protein